MSDRWTIHEMGDGHWSLRLKSQGNNEILLSSGGQVYGSRADALRAYKRTRWAAFRAFFGGLTEEPRNALP